MKQLGSKIKRYKYKNLTFLIAGLLLAFFLYRSDSFHTFLLSFGELGYLGAFIAGLLFVSSFSAATAVVILLVLADKLLPLEVALLAGLGAVCGDVLIFRFVKDDLIEEIRPVFERFGGRHVALLLRTKYFSWSLPLIGALLIASPLPDEVGVSLLGLSKMSTVKFLALSFTLNSLGILLLITAATFIKP